MPGTGSSLHAAFRLTPRRNSASSTKESRTPSPFVRESRLRLNSTSRALSVKSAERRFRVRRRPFAWRNVRVVLFVKFRVRRRPLFASGGMAKPEGGRRRFHGGRGNASKPAVESTTPIADRRFAMPPGSWSRVAQLHPQNSLKSLKISLA